MVQETPSGSPVYVALLHHSMRDKRGDVVTTAVTNLDVHDIARASRTYGVAGYFLVNPLAEQKEVVMRIVSHWRGSGGRDYNPDRSEAFSLIRWQDQLQDALGAIEEECGEKPLVVMTSARRIAGIPVWTAGELRARLREAKRPTLLVFGTGWGIVDDVLKTGDVLLGPIEPESASGYNHLSVRSAVAITLDRLLGARD